MWWDGGQGGLGGDGGFGGCGGFGVGLGGHGFVGGFGLGGGHGFVGGFGVGLTTTGGTTTGGTTTGGTTTGGTTTGGTTTGGTTTGGTTTGGTTTGGTTTVTGGTFTGSGTEIVTVPGWPLVGGLLDPVPDCADVDVDELPAADVEEVGGVGVATGVVGVTAVLGAGLADGVGVLVDECCFGTTISGLPAPAWGVEPK